MPNQLAPSNLPRNFTCLKHFNCQHGHENEFHDIDTFSPKRPQITTNVFLVPVVLIEHDSVCYIGVLY